jgi:zinc transport system substrate-binding protein
MRRVLLSVSTLLALATATVQAKPTVYVVNYPLYYFTERVAGDHVEVVFPAPSDVDPAFWKPAIATVAAYQAADLIVINGATYAQWLSQVSLPRAKIVDTSRGFKAHYIAMTEASTHSHGDDGVHSHTGTASTTWLNFQFAAQQARAIAQALSRMLPAQQATFEANYAALERDLLAFDQRLESMVAAKRTQPLVASHPVYQYLAARYGLSLRSVHWEPEEMPSDEQWQALHTLLADHAARWMIWEGEPLPASVAKLQAMGLRSLVFYPCGNRPAQGDFLSVMQQNVTNLAQAFQ